MKHLLSAAFLSLAVVGCSVPATENGGHSSAGSSSSGGYERLEKAGTRYTNDSVGYSILIPLSTTQWAPMQCSQAVTTVPVVALEDGDRTFITRAAEYDESCAEVVHDDAWFRANLPEGTRGITWILETRRISGDAELDSFIKERYGRDCSLGEKVETGQEGTYDVRIDGFGAPDDDYDCFVNYMTAIRYSPSRQRIVYWDMGQDISFPADPQYTSAYDFEMSNSFRFE